jgi:outer membrane protein
MTILRIGRVLAPALAAVVILVGVAAPASAADKIGGVNLQRILDDSSAGKEAVVGLRTQAEKESRKLKAMQDELEKLSKEIEGGKLMLTSQALQDKQNLLRRKEREFKLTQEDTRTAMQQAQGQTMRTIVNDIMRVIKEYGAKNGYTLVVEAGENVSMAGPMVLYLDKSVDITDAVIKIYDAEYKAKKK